MRRLLIVAALLVVWRAGGWPARSRTSPASGRRSSTRTRSDRVPGHRARWTSPACRSPTARGSGRSVGTPRACRCSSTSARCTCCPYILSGPTRLRISAQRDGNTERIVAFHQYIGLWGQERTIWVDGRPHPPDVAPHTWMGFSTGKWEGNTLVVRTTHIKQGWVRRNGVPQSDRW